MRSTHLRNVYWGISPTNYGRSECGVRQKARYVLVEMGGHEKVYFLSIGLTIFPPGGPQQAIFTFIEYFHISNCLAA